MVNFINKFVGFVVNPLFIGMMMVIAGFILIRMKRLRAASCMLAVSFVWFWFWSMPIVGGWLCLPLEKDFPVVLAEDMPKADAIVLLGGGIGGSTNYPYADLGPGADRAWHAARLWKAGKAPIIIPSNVGAELADIKLLIDLGVPRDAVILENRAVNTEENAKFVANLLSAKKSKILVVTSACHMKRSLYMFQKYAPELECVPAATDYGALPWKNEPFRWRGLLPNIGAFARINDFVHEYIGYYGYKIFR
jgi:uncharacterized SAM-binding protein YcdF (DUF218 family)